MIIIKIKEFSGLKVIYDKKYELICAIHAVYLLSHPELRDDEMEWVETPEIPYMEELEKIINSVEHQSLIDIILGDGFFEESTSINVALCLDDKYDVIDEKIDNTFFERFSDYETLYSFALELKNFASAIKWDEFFENHKEFYLNLTEDFCEFPKNLELSDLEKYFSKKKTTYYYIPSILMNGGFGAQDGLGHHYYIRGFQYDKEQEKFSYDLSYLCECLFHEFSHPCINPLVDKYFSLFTNIDEIYEDSIKNGLPKPYQKKTTLLYEYFVRASAKALNLKYYSDSDFGWVITGGFPEIEILTKFIIENRWKYEDYEEFFVEELIPFMNNILNYQDSILNNGKQQT